MREERGGVSEKAGRSPHRRAVDRRFLLQVVPDDPRQLHRPEGQHHTKATSLLQSGDSNQTARQRNVSDERWALARAPDAPLQHHQEEHLHIWDPATTPTNLQHTHEVMGTAFVVLSGVRGWVRCVGVVSAHCTRADAVRQCGALLFSSYPSVPLKGPPNFERIV